QLPQAARCGVPRIRLLLPDPAQRGRRARLRGGAGSTDLPPRSRGGVVGALGREAPTLGAGHRAGGAAARPGGAYLDRDAAGARAGPLMRIAVVSPHLPTPAMPMRGLSHDEQLDAFAEAGHEV